MASLCPRCACPAVHTRDGAATSGLARQTTPRPDARCRGVGVEGGARRHGCAGRSGVECDGFANQTSSSSAMGGLCGFLVSQRAGGDLGLRRSGSAPTPCVFRGNGNTDRRTDTVHSRPGTVWPEGRLFFAMGVGASGAVPFRRFPSPFLLSPSSPSGPRLCRLCRHRPFRRGLAEYLAGRAGLAVVYLRVQTRRRGG